ncbi:MAG: sulfotransferase [Candidatus Electrothrix sp. Rat3]|nr:sulfotransferase [Candidatus Electrothrix rattekaaiensis]
MKTRYQKRLKKIASCYYNRNPEEKSEVFLMNKASKKVGLDDWGNTNFVTALSRLLHSCRNEGNLNSFGWFYIHSLMTTYLYGRLTIEEYCKKNPEIKKERIDRPLFIISLPRTGTTLLQRLLTQASCARSLAYWEGLFPAPFPKLYPDSQKSDLRIRAAAQFLRIRNTVVPNINMMHPSYIRQPEECFHLLDKEFMSSLFHILFDLPSYYNWLNHQDMLPVYKYYKKQLQILQFSTPRNSRKRWILKSPFHMFGIDHLLKIFPDACIIQTHRSPAQSLSSLCSMLTTVRKNLQNKPVSNQLGRDAAQFWKNMLDNNMQIRSKYGEERFLDINYEKLVENPLEVSHNIYDYFDFIPNKNVTEKMKKWLFYNPKNKHGLHEYFAGNYGLSDEFISRLFGNYLERFKLFS